MLQNGFLNRTPLKKCAACKKKRPAHLLCDGCNQSHVCERCVSASNGQVREIRPCERCSRNFCEKCTRKCTDPDCQRVRCESCPSMAPCSRCKGVLCTEMNGDGVVCASSCNCNSMVCSKCSKSCNLCGAVLCESCCRGCTKCGDVFCASCEGFLMRCEFCDEEYCIICCARETTCERCLQQPSRNRLAHATAQLKRGLAKSSSDDKKPDGDDDNCTVDAGVRDEEQQGQEQRTELRQAKKKKRKGKKKNKAVADPGTSGSTRTSAVALAPSPAPAPEPPPARGSTPSVAPVSGSFYQAASQLRHNPLPLLISDSDSRIGSLNQVDDDGRVDHSLIKAWVFDVAAGRQEATKASLQRYFRHRVDPDVIDSYLEVFSNDYRTTAIQCAEFLDIIITQDVRAEETKSEETPASAEEDEDDDLIGTAFAAGERRIGGVHDFVEHPLEKRANDAHHRDCKDVKVLQNILDDAKGQPGLARTRKMLNKMIKRIKAAEEEQRKPRRDGSEAQRTKELSQQLHPAYMKQNKPSYSSWTPSGVSSDEEANAILEVPPNLVGWIIGKLGARIKDMQERTGARMWLDQNFPDGENHKLHLHGSKAQIGAAQKEVDSLLKSAPSARPRTDLQAMTVVRGSSQSSKLDQHALSKGQGSTVRVIDCPHHLVGLLIGKKGVMINRIKAQSGAHVEVFQEFPDGEPRKVFVNGSPECVEVAVLIIEDVITHGKAQDPSERNHSNQLTVDNTPNVGSPKHESDDGCLRQYKKTEARDADSMVPSITHDFADLGGLGRAVAQSCSPTDSGFGTGMDSDVDIQNAIEELHRSSTVNASASNSMELWAKGIGGMPPSSVVLSSPFVAHHYSAAAQVGVSHSNVHGESPSQQDALRMEEEQWLGFHPDRSFPERERSTRPMEQPQQPQQQGSMPARQLADHTSKVNSEGFAAFHSWNELHTPNNPITLGINADSSASVPGRSQDRAPFASVAELLASVGHDRLLPNFMEQEFDVTAIALMTDKDFEEIKVPKGPQLKIQRACRKAGLCIDEDKRSYEGKYVSEAQGGPPGTSRAVSSHFDDDDDNMCVICLERDVQVTFIGCGHQACCIQCGSGQVGRPCPMCRAPVTDAIRFYR